MWSARQFCCDNSAQVFAIHIPAILYICARFAPFSLTFNTRTPPTVIKSREIFSVTTPNFHHENRIYIVQLVNLLKSIKTTSQRQLLIVK